MHSKENDTNKSKDNSFIKNQIKNDILLQITNAPDYEIAKEYFKIITISALGNCLYCSISMHYYKNENSHMKFRNDVYNYLKRKKDEYINFFITNTEEEDSIDELYKKINDYIEINNNFGKYADLEISIIVDMLNIKIILLTSGYVGYNVYNAWEPKNYNELSDKIIILLYNKDIKHYDYLEIKKEVFTDDNYIQVLLEKIKNNIEKRSIIY